MKEQVSPVILIAAGVAAALLIGFLVWRFFWTTGDAVDTATINARIAAKKARGN